MSYSHLRPRFTPLAHVEEISSGHYRLSIPAGQADEYRLAQLDDYTQIPKRHLFPHRFGLTLSLSARTSNASLPGTWGFGLWNDPFGWSLGFGGKPFRIPALPNVAWFFGASRENYLSFSNKPANGFLAQTFRSPKFHPLLLLAGLALPFSRKWTRRLLSRVILEDGRALNPPPAQESAEYADRISRRSPLAAPASAVVTPQEEAVRVDPAQWHRYRLEWSLKRVSFEVDEVRVFESAVSPNPPLGVVIWIDNQYAAFTPEGKIGFGVLANPEPAWLEVKELEIR
ncbi:MAG: hypothetical protein ACOYYF_02255 [Chloroflexota bacterium]|nr:hypothetical protein [Chloroflexota bacterium]MBI5704011.1 hypothetical protein [Chloroflexota bacterium]